MPFVRMHGIGNDYIYLDEQETAIPAPSASLARWARRLADRHSGIGGDGLIILRRDPDFPCRMEMYNADGSRAEMCGNGLRCVAKLAWERGYSQGMSFFVNTDSGPREVQVLMTDDAPGAGCVEVRVRAAMGVPETVEESLQVMAGGKSFRGTYLRLGNPHFVVELSTDLASFPVEKHGPLLECHERFEERANVEFVQIRDPQQMNIRVWERGAGETRACGTGACAAVAALHQLGQVADQVTVHLSGGDLRVEVAENGNIWMTGPAQEICRGTFRRELVE
ncbi:MAG: diaminopimelate epimerase [Planctomycetota bacterium]